jgi:hypothetical protein
MENISAMDTNIYDFQIRILISPEDGEFTAHALEMDLVAYGKTEKEAVKELKSLVFNQISFAIERSEEHLMVFPAPKEFFAQWEAAQSDALKGIAKARAKKVRVKAVGICFSESDIRKVTRGNIFDPVPVPACG